MRKPMRCRNHAGAKQSRGGSAGLPLSVARRAVNAFDGLPDDLVISVPRRPRRGGADVQEVPGAGGAPGRAVASVGVRRRRARVQVVEAGARVPPATSMPATSSAWCASTASACAGCREWPRGGAVCAGRGAVQRQRRR